MVSNEEVSRRNENKGNKNSPVDGYFQCDQCRGYYELQPGESVEDYDVCYCGGKLKYIKPRVFYDDDSVLESYYLMLRKFFIFVGILAVIALIPIIVWYFRI